MLDVSSLLVMHVSMMLALGGLFTAVVVLAPDWRFPWQWAGAFFAMPVVMIAIGLAEAHDSDGLRIAGPVIGLVGPALALDGLRRFVGAPPARTVWALVAVTLVGATSVFVWVFPSFQARIAVVLVFVVIGAIYILRLLTRVSAQEHPVTARVLRGVVWIVLVVNLVRLAATLSGHTLPVFAGDSGIGASMILLGNAIAALFAVGFVILVAERFAAQIRREAETDALTGLATRRVFDRALMHEIARWHRYRREVSLVLFDIDHFKQINDDHGHDVGDRALEDVADCGRREVRPTDLFARLGGDEFAVLLPETGGEEAAQVATRILDALRAISIASHTGRVALSGSFGITTSVAADETPESLFKRADEALYDVKRAGRNGLAGRWSGPAQGPVALPRS